MKKINDRFYRNFEQKIEMTFNELVKIKDTAEVGNMQICLTQSVKDMALADFITAREYINLLDLIDEKAHEARNSIWENELEDFDEDDYEIIYDIDNPNYEDNWLRLEED